MAQGLGQSRRCCRPCRMATQGYAPQVWRGKWHGSLKQMKDGMSADFSRGMTPKIAVSEKTSNPLPWRHMLTSSSKWLQQWRRRWEKTFEIQQWDTAQHIPETLDVQIIF